MSVRLVEENEAMLLILRKKSTEPQDLPEKLHKGNQEFITNYL